MQEIVGSVHCQNIEEGRGIPGERVCTVRGQGWQTHKGACSPPPPPPPTPPHPTPHLKQLPPLQPSEGLLDARCHVVEVLQAGLDGPHRAQKLPGPVHAVLVLDAAGGVLLHGLQVLQTVHEGVDVPAPVSKPDALDVAGGLVAAGGLTGGAPSLGLHPRLVLADTALHEDRRSALTDQVAHSLLEEQRQGRDKGWEAREMKGDRERES
jgi:hypothetical protein